MDRGSVLIGALLAGVICNVGYIPKAVHYFQASRRPPAVSRVEPKSAAPSEVISIPQPAPMPLSEIEAPASIPEKALHFERETDTETLRIMQESLRGLGKFVKNEIGVHGPSGMPQDHVQMDLKTGKAVGYPANYAAPSKLAVYLPFLLKAAQGHPVLKKTGISREEALEMARHAFSTLRNFQRRTEGRQVYGGLFPWFEMKGDGSLEIAKYGGRRMVPVLDNGQLTLAFWAWAGDETIQKAKDGTLEQEIRILVNELIDNQHYEKWADPKTGLLYAEWNLDEKKGLSLSPDVSLWTEWMMAPFVASVQGRLPMKNWLQLSGQTFSYKTKDRVLDMPQGYIFSMHEMWSLVYLGRFMMNSRLAPLLRDYFYLHAEHSLRRNVPGIVATEYGPDGYTQAGIDLARLGKGQNGKIESENQSTAYGSALASLIAKPQGFEWTLYHFKQPGVINSFGPVTSFSRMNGATPMYTADASFMTATALAGGVSDEILKYVNSKYHKTEKDLIAFFDSHADKILKGLGRNEFQSVREDEIPEPPYPGDYSASVPEPEQELQGTLVLSEKLQSGHWHGSNIFVPSAFIKYRTDENQSWVMHDDEIIGQYQITNAKRYAWLGTPVTPVSIKGAKYISFWVPVDLTKEAWQIELKNSSVEIAQRLNVETYHPGETSQDKLWKRLVIPLRVFPGRKNTLNYFAISVPDPFIKKSRYKQSGLIRIKDIQLHSEDPRPAASTQTT